MRANILATIERKAPTLDHFIGEVGEWVEVARAWVTVDPPAVFAQRQEFFQNEQTQAQIKHIVRAVWSPDLANIDTACRLRLTTNDGIERTLHIHNVINPNSGNRMLELLCVEAV